MGYISIKSVNQDQFFNSTVQDYVCLENTLPDFLGGGEKHEVRLRAGKLKRTDVQPIRTEDVCYYKVQVHNQWSQPQEIDPKDLISTYSLFGHILLKVANFTLELFNLQNKIWLDESISRECGGKTYYVSRKDAHKWDIAHGNEISFFVLDGVLRGREGTLDPLY